MSHEHRFGRPLLRRLALAVVVATGIASILGSGGGASEAECSFFSNVCHPVVTPPQVTPAVSIRPVTVTVQAGTSVAFTAQSVGIDQPEYQWRRSADGGATFVDIAGATLATYTLASTQFADHGALFRVDVRGRGGNTVVASSNAATLLLSSMPAVVLADGEFDAAGWSSTAIADPAQGGPTHAEERRASGGLPGAYRHMVHNMTAGPSSLRVFNLKASATYDPRALGAILAIDYSEDCDRVSASSASFGVLSFPMLEQAGRRYVSVAGRGCLSLWVNNFAQLPSLAAGDFVQVDGPACGGGESCPDFSARGATIQFGFERRVNLAPGLPAGSIGHGIDNWQIRVWRP